MLTGRADVPEYKQARGYRYEPDKFTAADLSPVACDLVSVLGVAESPIHMEGHVQRMHPIGGAGAGLRAVEVLVMRTHIDEDLLMAHNDRYIDPLRWDPLIMKFTEFFAGGRPVHPSSLARGWGMPKLGEQPPDLRGPVGKVAST